LISGKNLNESSVIFAPKIIQNEQILPNNNAEYIII